jgi:hypothetical protein
MGFVMTILSEEEIVKLPQSEKPLNHRISSEVYHRIHELVGEATMCWNPRPSENVFDSELASDVAVRLCLLFADELEKKEVKCGS